MASQLILIIYRAFSEQTMMPTPFPSNQIRTPSPSFFHWSNFFLQGQPTMDPISASPESSPSSKDAQIDQALDLLELCWFFDNLLNGSKPRMSTSRSDPCLSKATHQVFVQTPPHILCSSTLDVDVSPGNGVGKRRSLLRTPSLPSRMKREDGIRGKGNGSRPLSEHGVFVESPACSVCSPALDMDVSPANGVRKPPNLLRTPSLPSRMEHEEGIREKGNGCKPLSDHSLLQKPAKPPYIDRKEEGTRSKENGSARRSKSTRGRRHSNLLRTPSLPPCIGREKEFGEKEAAARIRNFTQPNLSDLLPTRQEILEKNFSLPMCRTPTSKDEMWHQLLIQMRKRRSQSELESEELQGFKDLGFTFDQKDINPTVVDIIPGLRERKEEELESERGTRPYLSEAWMLQTQLPPPIPKWDTRKTAEDMKQQIKFWARAVASNVH